MSENYEAYLDSSTRLMMDYFSSSGADEEEKQIVITAFTEMLTEHIGESSAVADNEKIIYDTSIRYLDTHVSKTVADLSASYGDCEKAISCCRRIADLQQFYSTKKWEFPVLSTRDIAKSETVLTQRMESSSIVKKIAEEDNKISLLLTKAQKSLEVKICDEIIMLLDELVADVQACKQKKIAVHIINNKDAKKVAKNVASIRKDAEQKEKIHQKIYELDAQIQNIISLPKSTPENWCELIQFCQQQKSYLSECSKKQWPMPIIRNINCDELITQYQHYLKMNELDIRLFSSSYNALSDKKEYRNFIADCDKQELYIETCRKNGWGLPDLRISDPKEVCTAVAEQRAKIETAKKRKRKAAKVYAIVVLIVVAGIYGIVKYQQGIVKIPFDASYVEGADLNTIYSELKSAGFKNIVKNQVNTGWMESGKVVSVSIDSGRGYIKDKYVDSNVLVNIAYSSPGRVYVTDILKDWSTLPYLDVERILNDAGFTNIFIEAVETTDKEKDQISEGLILNGLTYYNEECYLPKNALITLSYYTFVIGIGNDNKEYVGRNFEDVVKELQNSGFTNVQTEKITTGWAEGNTVVGVTVNNNDNYSSNESFSPDAKIVVKYSSNERIDITKNLEGWTTKKYDIVQSALQSAGMKNIVVISKTTANKAENLMIASITVNDTPYTDGGCFVPPKASIVIEYYELSIKIGQKSSDITANIAGYYSSEVTYLKNLGFTDISVYRNNSLCLGLISKEGSIDTITIGGKSIFTESDCFDYDAPIVIVVNTFRKNGCEDVIDIWQGNKA